MLNQLHQKGWFNSNILLITFQLVHSMDDEIWIVWLLYAKTSDSLHENKCFSIFFKNADVKMYSFSIDKTSKQKKKIEKKSEKCFLRKKKRDYEKRWNVLLLLLFAVNGCRIFGILILKLLNLKTILFTHRFTSA